MLFRSLLLVVEEDVARQLLGDRRGALDTPAALIIDIGGAQDAEWIDAQMAVDVLADFPT